MHNYSCATHCHKWFKATKKGTRKAPEVGPVGDLRNWITNTASGLASLAVGVDRKSGWGQGWCCTSLFFILFRGACFWQLCKMFLNLISLWSDIVCQGLLFLCTSYVKMYPTCTPPLWNPGKLSQEMARGGVNPHNLSFNKALLKQRTGSSGNNVSPQERNTIVCSVASLSWLKMEEKGKACQLIAGLMEKLSLHRPRASKLACCSHYMVTWTGKLVSLTEGPSVRP